MYGKKRKEKIIRRNYLNSHEEDTANTDEKVNLKKNDF